jgi:hypothetical protein
MVPDLLAGIEVPGLQLADVVGTRDHREDHIRWSRSGKTLPRRIGDRLPGKRVTKDCYTRSETDLRSPHVQSRIAVNTSRTP